MAGCGPGRQATVCRAWAKAPQVDRLQHAFHFALLGIAREIGRNLPHHLGKGRHVAGVGLFFLHEPLGCQGDEASKLLGPRRECQQDGVIARRGDRRFPRGRERGDGRAVEVDEGAGDAEAALVPLNELVGAEAGPWRLQPKVDLGRCAEFLRRDATSDDEDGGRDAGRVGAEDRRHAYGDQPGAGSEKAGERLPVGEEDGVSLAQSIALEESERHGTAAREIEADIGEDGTVAGDDGHVVDVQAADRLLGDVGPEKVGSGASDELVGIVPAAVIRGITAQSILEAADRLDDPGVIFPGSPFFDGPETRLDRLQGRIVEEKRNAHGAPRARLTLVTIRLTLVTIRMTANSTASYVRVWAFSLVIGGCLLVASELRLVRQTTWKRHVELSTLLVSLHARFHS